MTEDARAELEDFALAVAGACNAQGERTAALECRLDCKSALSALEARVLALEAGAAAAETRFLDAEINGLGDVFFDTGFGMALGFRQTESAPNTNGLITRSATCFVRSVSGECLTGRAWHATALSGTVLSLPLNQGYIQWRGFLADVGQDLLVQSGLVSFTEGGTPQPPRILVGELRPMLTNRAPGIAFEARVTRVSWEVITVRVGLTEGVTWVPLHY